MCACPCLTFIAGDERPVVALQVGGDDGAVSVGQDELLLFVEHVLPPVGAGLHTAEGRESPQNHTAYTTQPQQTVGL